MSKGAVGEGNVISAWPAGAGTGNALGNDTVRMMMRMLGYGYNAAGLSYLPTYII